MKTKTKASIPLIMALSLTTSTSIVASEGLEACENATTPFNWVRDDLIDNEVSNPPLNQLCHRIGSAEKHHGKGRVDKSIEELHKFINQAVNSVPKNLSTSQSASLVTMAEKAILYLEGGYFTSVTGGVYQFGTNSEVSGAAITLTFLDSETVLTTTTDANGLFKFDDVEPNGQYIITATSTTGETGSVQGTALLGNQILPSVITIDYPGAGIVQGQVIFEDSTPANGSLVNISFPESGREYSTQTDSLGTYSLSGVHLDGTVIILAFEPISGASASKSSVLIQSDPSISIDLTLEEPKVVNPELLNADFSDGFEGWSVEGTTELVDRNLIFSSDN